MLRRYEVDEVKRPPITRNLDLQGVGTEELHNWVGVAEKRQYQAPSFRSTLDVIEFLLQTTLLFCREM